MIFDGTTIFVLGFVAAWASTRMLIGMLRSKGVMDVPNARSSHVIATPRGGGIGIIFGVGTAMLGALWLQAPTPPLSLIVAALMVALIGMLDDYHQGLPAWSRLVAQTCAAAVVVFSNGGWERVPLPAPLDFRLGVWAIPVSLIWIVGVTNIYNFLDGIDGYAGAQGVVAALAVVALGIAPSNVVLGCALAGACAGFLVHNWHPAKIFMGDVGSGTIGFVLAAAPFALPLAARPTVVLVIALALWFFLADGAFTLLCRLRRGERVWTPHRTHLYQRLVTTGLSHEQVVKPLILAAGLLASLAVIAAKTGDAKFIWLVLLLAGFAFGMLWRWTRHRETNTNLQPVKTISQAEG